MTKKLLLVFFGILIGFILIELVLQIGSFIVYEEQRKGYQKEENAYKILVIGESTSADMRSRYFSKYDNDAGPIPWPRLLESYLNNNSNREFKVYNEAIPGVNTGMLLSKLDENIKKYDPELVISMMGNGDYSNSVHLCDLKKPNAFRPKLFGLKDWIRFSIKKRGERCNDLLNQTHKNNFNLAISLVLEGKKKEALDIIEGLKDSKNCDSKRDLAVFYMTLGEHAKNEEERLMSFQRSLSIYEELQMKYAGEDYTLERIDLYALFFSISDSIEIKESSYEKMLTLLSDSVNIVSVHYPHIINVWSRVLNQNNEQEKLTRLLKKIDPCFILMNQSTESMTKLHYNELNDILNQRKIRYVAMQYPTLGIDDIKIYFKDKNDTSIIYVENKENFEMALKRYNYSSLFTDKLMGRNFGHATTLGNSLIAKNVGKAILAEINTTG